MNSSSFSFRSWAEFCPFFQHRDSLICRFHCVRESYYLPTNSLIGVNFVSFLSFREKLPCVFKLLLFEYGYFWHHSLFNLRNHVHKN